MDAKPDIGAMRRRIAYLRRQSAVYRGMAGLPMNRRISTHFTALADRCTEVAGAIERNIAAGLFDAQNDSGDAVGPAAKLVRNQPRSP